MTGKSPTARSDRRLARLAARQHGVVSRKQLRYLDIGDRAIDYGVSVGRLHRVFRGVYSVGHNRLTDHGRLMAAALACSKGTVISHRSAAALLELADRGPDVVDVIAPGDRGRHIDGIRFIA